MLVEVVRPWRYSRHGHDVQNADAGAMLDLPEDLAKDGIATGHLQPAVAKQALSGPPERKRRRKA